MPVSAGVKYYGVVGRGMKMTQRQKTALFDTKRFNAQVRLDWQEASEDLGRVSGLIENGDRKSLSRGVILLTDYIDRLRAARSDAREAYDVAFGEDGYRRDEPVENNA